MRQRKDFDLTCPKCGHRCSCFEGLITHYQRLVVELDVIHVCPVCKTIETARKDCLDHILQHVSFDELCLSQLMVWMSSLNYKTGEELPPEEPKKCRAKTVKTPKSKLVKKFSIRLPSIQLQNKCPYCSTFFYSSPDTNEYILEHVLSHAIPTEMAEKIAPWLKEFFEDEDSKPIVADYRDFVSKAKILEPSTLLEQLHIFENDKTNVCRYCELQLEKSSTLYRHYVEWHNNPPTTKYFNCFLCNYKGDENEYMTHVFRRHMGCMCGEKFEAFDECLGHVRKCSRYCPYCKKKCTFDRLMKHLDKAEPKPVKGCPFCHNNITVNYSNEELEIHVQECTSRPNVGVHCPLCKKNGFFVQSQLRQHCLNECKPWIANSEDENVPYCLKNPRKTRCLSGKKLGS